MKAVIYLPLYEQQLSETNTAINNLPNAIQQGILTKAQLEELENNRAELENKIALEKLAKLLRSVFPVIAMACTFSLVGLLQSLPFLLAVHFTYLLKKR